MRHGNSSRRQRKRGGNGGNRRGPNKMQVFDSNGPEVRIRGTAHQVFEKYQALAKDAQSSGNTVLAESYLQHAEHYQRIINEFDSYKDDQKSTQSSQEDDAFEEGDLSLPGSILGAEKSKSSAQAEAKQLEAAD